MNPPIKAILFDYDDTLVKTKETVWKAHKIAAQKFYNLDLSEEFMSLHRGKPYRTMLIDMYSHVDSYENLHQNYMTVRRDYPMKIFEETLAVINQLLASYPVGIVTSASLELILFDFQMLHFPNDQFLFVQTADDTSVHKPDPDVFKPALAKLEKRHIRASETLYVGDDLRDYQAATGAGMQFIGIARNGSNSFHEVNTPTINSLTELLNLNL